MFHFVLGEGSRHVVTKWDTVKDSNIGDNLEKCVQYLIQELHLLSHLAANGQRTAGERTLRSRAHTFNFSW